MNFDNIINVVISFVYFIIRFVGPSVSHSISQLRYDLKVIYFVAISNKRLICFKEQLYNLHHSICKALE